MFASSVLLTLYNPMDCSLPSSSAHGIFQARTLEWVAIPLPGDLSDPEIKPVLVLLAASALVGGSFTTEPSEKLKQ